MMTPMQLFHPRHSDTIVSHIRNLVRQGVLRPGDRIPPERDLARELSMGRGTVREAFHQLEALGVIERAAKSRIVSRSRLVKEKPGRARTLEDERRFLIQVIDARIGLEGWVAAEVARRAEPADIAHLRRLLQKLQHALHNKEKLAAVDLEFHRALVKATHNEIVGQVLDSLSTMIKSVAAFKRLTLHPMRKVDTVQHRKIVDAIERKDARAAQAAMIAHLHKVRSAIHRTDQER